MYIYSGWVYISWTAVLANGGSYSDRAQSRQTLPRHAKGNLNCTFRLQIMFYLPIILELFLYIILNLYFFLDLFQKKNLNLFR